MAPPILLRKLVYVKFALPSPSEGKFIPPSVKSLYKLYKSTSLTVNVIDNGSNVGTISTIKYARPFCWSNHIPVLIPVASDWYNGVELDIGSIVNIIWNSYA